MSNTKTTAIVIVSSSVAIAAAYLIYDYEQRKKNSVKGRVPILTQGQAVFVNPNVVAGVTPPTSNINPPTAAPPMYNPNQFGSCRLDPDNPNGGGGCGGRNINGGVVIMPNSTSLSETEKKYINHSIVYQKVIAS